jgi:hypothetical protein
LAWHVCFVPHPLHAATVAGAAWPVHAAPELLPPLLEELLEELDELDVPLPEPELPELPELPGACVPPEPEAVAPGEPASAVDPDGVAEVGRPVCAGGAGSVGACDVVSPPVVSVVPTAHASSASAARATTNGATRAAGAATGRAGKAFSFGSCLVLRPIAMCQRR